MASTGNDPDPAEGLIHRCAVYRGTDSLVDLVAGFVDDAVAQQEPVVSLVADSTWKVLTNRLGVRSGHVTPLAEDQWAHAPNQALIQLDRHRRRWMREPGPGRRIRFLLELQRPGLDAAEGRDWSAFERTVDVTFGPTPLTLLCLADGERLDADALARFTRDHHG